MEIWAALVGVVGTGFLALVGSIVMGKLVPSSRVDEARRTGDTRLAEAKASAEAEARSAAADLAEAESRVEKAQREADTWHATADSIKSAFDSQTKIVERQQLSAEITDKLMTVVDERLAALGGGTP